MKFGPLQNQSTNLSGKPRTTIAAEVIYCLHTSFDLATATSMLCSFSILARAPLLNAEEEKFK